jgi:fructose-bisphosphate aldolase class II
MLQKNICSNRKAVIQLYMIDLSEEPIEENIEICKGYLARMSKMGMTLKSNLELQVEKKMALTTRI